MPVRSRRHLLIGGLILLGLVGVLQVAIELVVDADFLAGRLHGALGPGSRWTVQLGGANPGFLGGSLTATDLMLTPADTARGRSPAFAVDRIEVGGIDRWRLLSRQTVRAGRVTVTGGQIDLPGTTPGPDLTGVAVIARDVDLSGRGLDAADRVVGCRDIVVTVPACRWRTPDSVRELGPLRLSVADSLLRIEHFAMLPVDSTGQPAPLRELSSQGTQLVLGPLELDGLRLHDLLGSPRITVGHGELDSLSLHVFSDMHLPDTASVQPAMLHRKLRDLIARVHLDSLHVTRAEIRYSERPGHGGEAGHVRFRKVQATLANLGNDPTRVSTERPFQLAVTAALGDSARLDVRLRQDLQQPEVDAAIEGSLVRISAAWFNEILTPLEGIRFTSGYMDTLDFQYVLRRNLAEGEARGRFQDLKVKIVGRDRESGLLEDLEGLLGNLLVLRGESDGGASPNSLQSVPIRYERLQGDTYIKFVWAGLRSGLKNLIGL